MKCRLVWPVILVVLIALPACNRSPKPEVNDESSFDHISQGPKLEPKLVAHGVSKLDKYEKFTFEVPAHVITPRLRGEFSSFIQGKDGARISDESADLELMVMSEEQLDAFTHHRSAESLYAVEPSHDHGVSIALPSTQDTAVHYYVVFRRANEGKSPVWLKSDLTVEFGPES